MAAPVIAGLSRVAINKLMKSASGKRLLASLKKKLASGTKKVKKNLKKVAKDVNKKVSPKKTAGDRKDAKLTGKDARNRDLNLNIAGAGRAVGIAPLVAAKDAADKKNKKPNPKAKGLNVGSKQNISSAKKKAKGVASSFDEAFKANRAVKGAGQTFTYKGKSYTTDTKADLDKKKKDVLTKKMARSGARIKNMRVGGKVRRRYV
tara:strand:+ start:270 stop:884 length:615 start_codon:yes stop_codon:yes gene_type:complete